MMFKLFKTPEERAVRKQENQTRHQAEIDACYADRKKKLENTMNFVRREISMAIAAGKRFMNLGPYQEPFLEAVIAVSNEEGSWVLDIQPHSYNDTSNFNQSTSVLIKLAVAPKCAE